VADSPGTAAIGIGAIGFGSLMIYSAYTKKPLFGENGLLRTFLTDGDFAKAGKTAAEISQWSQNVPMGTRPDWSQNFPARPANNPPRGVAT
jgi:hypothetical protein